MAMLTGVAMSGLAGLVYVHVYMYEVAAYIQLLETVTSMVDRCPCI